MTPETYTSTSAALDHARRREFVVLLVISSGLICILLAIVAGVFSWFKQTAPIPDWSENVLVAIATAAILKLGDCLNALVQLATGRQVMQLGDKLANSKPVEQQVPEDAGEGAQDAADAAQRKADQLKGDAP